jgi:hypothetical protein
MEDDLIFLEEDNLIYFLWKTTSKKLMQPKASKSKNNGCGTALGNLVK